MFILTDTNSGGIYATTDNFNQKSYISLSKKKMLKVYKSISC